MYCSKHGSWMYFVVPLQRHGEIMAAWGSVQRQIRQHWGWGGVRDIGYGKVLYFQEKEYYCYLFDRLFNYLQSVHQLINQTSIKQRQNYPKLTVSELVSPLVHKIQTNSFQQNIQQFPLAHPQMTQDTNFHLQTSQEPMDAPDLDQSHIGIIEINEEDYSFNSGKFRTQNWEHLHHYDDDSDDGGDSSSGFANVQECQCDSFVEQSKKVLGDFAELKSAQKRAPGMGQQLPFDIQDHQDSKKKQSRPQKPRRPKLPKMPTISIPHYQPDLRRLSNLTNLKSISHEVCDFVECSPFITYRELFERFVGRDQSNNKNLRRRMYDVINVLSSAKVLERRGLILKKYSKQKNAQMTRCVSNPKQERTSTEGKRLRELKKELRDRKQNIEQKRELLQQLKKKKQNLQKLQRRNTSWCDKIPQETRLYFPLYFYQASAGMNVQINHSHTQIKFIKCPITSMSMSMNLDANIKEENSNEFHARNERFLYTDLDLLQFVKFRRNRKLQDKVEVDKAKFEHLE